MENYADIQMKRMPAIRRIISKRMSEAWLVPTFNVTTEVSLDNYLACRKKLATKPSLTAMIITDLAKALLQHKTLNGIIQGEQFGISEAIHMGLAMDGPDGLVVITLKDADKKTAAELHEEIRTRQSELESRNMSMDHLSGATFTLSNLGAFGVSSCRAILNPPQVGILALGGSVKKMVLDKDGNPVEIQYMNCTLTADHRAVDGADGARFLNTFKSIIESRTA